MLESVKSPIAYPRFSSTGNPDEDRLAVVSFLERRWGLGVRAKQQVEVPYLAASSATNIAEVPNGFYSGMVVHSITPNRLLPNAIQLTLSHREVAQHTLVLSANRVEIPFWTWVTDADPLYITVTNRLPFNAFVGLTLATSNF